MIGTDVIGEDGVGEKVAELCVFKSPGRGVLGGLLYGSTGILFGSIGGLTLDT